MALSCLLVALLGSVLLTNEFSPIVAYVVSPSRTGRRNPTEHAAGLCAAKLSRKTFFELKKSEYLENQTYLWSQKEQNNACDTELSTTGRYQSLATQIRPILVQILSPIVALYRFMFRAAASFVASFLTAVILHPALTQALGVAVKEGLNLWLTQPDVKHKIVAFQQTMATSSPSLARPIGNDFIRVFSNFIQGLLSPKQSYGKFSPMETGNDEDARANPKSEKTNSLAEWTGFWEK